MAVAILVPVSAALAGYQAGGFGGTTEQMEAIGFRAEDGKVRRLATTVYAECGDATRQRITLEKGRTEIDGDDRFSLELTGASDLKVTVVGRLRGERAAGRIEATVKPPGTTCRADVRWQAALTRPSA
ncbi:MAG TPA: hypothetical protein VFY99_04165 [Solirubrobacterales bacterium]